MLQHKRQALEEAGFRIGNAEDFLDLSEEERSIVELRVAVSRTIRKLRGKKHLSQAQLAEMLGSSQSRVAKIEAAAKDVSLDLLFRGLFALGGRLSDLSLSPGPARPRRGSHSVPGVRRKARHRKKFDAVNQ
jgi:predicted XRE-type DNA-binding protein